MSSLFLSISASQAAVVSSCDENGLRAAISAGGVVTFACNGEIVLNNTIEITNSVSLDGSGRAVVIRGGGSNRVFTLRSGVINFTNIAIINGVATNGGGIFNVDATVWLHNVSFSNNIAMARQQFTFGSADGGALYNGGIVQATNCTFRFNHTGTNDVISPALPVWDSRGGALFNKGTTELYSCVFEGNAAFGGHGINDIGGKAGSNAWGGAVFNSGTLVACESVMIFNVAAAGSGGNSGSTNVSGSHFGSAGGAAGTAFGGGLFNSGWVNVTACTLASNIVSGAAGGRGDIGTASQFGQGGAGGAGGAGGVACGGAIFSYGTAVVTRTTFHRNSGIGGAGGLGGNGGFGGTAGSGGGGGRGGDAFGAAIQIGFGQLDVTNCTLALNDVFGGNGGNAGSAAAASSLSGSIGGSGGNGGRGGNASGAALVSSNSLIHCAFVTIASNSVQSGSGGTGGQNTCGRALVNPCGIAGVAGQTGAITGTSIGSFGSTVQLNASLIQSGTTNANIAGPIQDGGFNICSDASAAFANATSVNNTDSKLGALMNNGGPTETMALLDDSPAIDRVPASAAPPIDQRGIARPLGLQADSGAVERTSPLRLTIEKTSTAITVSFRVEAGNVYRLQRSESFSAWTDILTNMPLNNATLRIELPSTEQSEFYRVAKP